MPYTERLRAGIVEITFDSTSADSTYELPAPYIPGKRLRIRRTDSSSHRATVTVSSGGTIDGVTDATIEVPPNGDFQIEKGDGNVWESYGAVDVSGSATAAVGSDAWLKLHAGGNLDALIVGTVTRDSNGAATSAGVVWPDGTTGTYTATTVSTAFPGAVDAYTVTYAGSTTKTVTQSAVTRDATTGAVTTQPAMTVA